MPAEITFNLDNLKKKVDKLGKNTLQLKVGFLDTKFAQIAQINEFGAKINVTKKMQGWFLYNFGIHKNNNPIIIPPRPFMQTTVNQKSKDWKNLLINLLQKNEPKQAILNLGVVMQQDIQKTISNNDFAPNSQFTIMKKGRNQPLIDTGEMRRNVDFEVKVG